MVDWVRTEFEADARFTPDSPVSRIRFYFVPETNEPYRGRHVFWAMREDRRIKFNDGVGMQFPQNVTWKRYGNQFPMLDGRNPHGTPIQFLGQGRVTWTPQIPTPSHLIPFLAHRPEYDLAPTLGLSVDPDIKINQTDFEGDLALTHTTASARNLGFVADVILGVRSETESSSTSGDSANVVLNMEPEIVSGPGLVMEGIVSLIIETEDFVNAFLVVSSLLGVSNNTESHSGPFMDAAVSLGFDAGAIVTERDIEATASMILLAEVLADDQTPDALLGLLSETTSEYNDGTGGGTMDVIVQLGLEVIEDPETPPLVILGLHLPPIEGGPTDVHLRLIDDTDPDP